MNKEKFDQLLKEIGLNPKSTPDTQLSQLVSRKKRLDAVLASHEMGEVDFYRFLLGEKPLNAKKSKDIGEYEIIPYNPRIHDIRDLRLLFEKEVIGGERRPPEEEPLLEQTYVAAVSGSQNSHVDEVLGYYIYSVPTYENMKASELGNIVHLNEIMVAKDLRNQHIGHWMHDSLTTIALDLRETHDIHCIATASGPKSMHFFHNLGYQEIGIAWNNKYENYFCEMAMWLDEKGKEKIIKLLDS